MYGMWISTIELSRFDVQSTDQDTRNFETWNVACEIEIIVYLR